MTDRYKGFLVTLDKDIRDDDAEAIIIALQMVKHVHSVTPYVKSGEDYMCEYKTRLDTYHEIIQAIFKCRDKSGAIT